MLVVGDGGRRVGGRDGWTLRAGRALILTLVLALRRRTLVLTLRIALVLGRVVDLVLGGRRRGWAGCLILRFERGNGDECGEGGGR